MPAYPTTLEELFDTQHIVESAFSTYLTNNGLSSIHSRSTGNLPDARIIVRYEEGGAVNHEAPSSVTLTGANEFDWFSGVITFEIQTERAKCGVSPIAGIADIHDYWVARLRVLLLRGAINGTIPGIVAPLSIPYYSIPVLGSLMPRDSVAEDAFDATLLTCSMQIRILPTAWPVIVLPA